MDDFLHRLKQHIPNIVGLAHFFQRPLNARISGQSFAVVGRPFKGGFAFRGT